MAHQVKYLCYLPQRHWTGAARSSAGIPKMPESDAAVLTFGNMVIIL